MTGLKQANPLTEHMPGKHNQASHGKGGGRAPAGRPSKPVRQTRVRRGRDGKAVFTGTGATSTTSTGGTRKHGASKLRDTFANKRAAGRKTVASSIGKDLGGKFSVSHNHNKTSTHLSFSKPAKIGQVDGILRNAGFKAGSNPGTWSKSGMSAYATDGKGRRVGDGPVRSVVFED